MKRIAVVVAFALLFTAGATFAQFGGMGGMGGPVMKGTAKGGGYGSDVIRRAVQVEMEGGRNLNAQIELANLVIQGDLGQYSIEPEKIRMIRFLKPPVEPGDDDDAPTAAGGGNINPNLMKKAMAPRKAAMAMPTARAKVILNSGEEIIGYFQYGMSFRLDLDYGSIIPAMDKLRSMTFADVARKADPAGPGQGQVHAAGADPNLPAASPQFYRHAQCLVVRSPSGDRVVLYDIDSRRSQDLCGPGDPPLEVRPVSTQHFMALGLVGAKIRRVAVADATGWQVQELRQPSEGRLEPIVSQSAAVYVAGRYAYAYSVLAHRWEVAELPEGLRASPLLGPNTATITGDGHIYTFSAQAGKWEHVDLGAILNAAGK